jgi:DNA invertase Pin-like site-specific DNA recombinase
VVCQEQGAAVDEELPRHGLSAWKGANAKQGELKLFLEAIKSGEVRPGDFLLVEKIDRISRQGVDLGMDLIKEILRAGVNIVTLSNGRVYTRECLTGLMKGLLELQIMLEQAKEYSDALSKRVGSAWQRKKEKARENGTLATAAMPPWLAAVGKGDERRAVVVNEKADVVRRIFDLAIGGHGCTRLVRLLIEEKVPPITRRGRWSRTSVRRIITDRAVLGEHQPMLGRGRDRKPDGAPIEGYYAPSSRRRRSTRRRRAWATGR